MIYCADLQGNHILRTQGLVLAVLAFEDDGGFEDVDAVPLAYGDAEARDIATGFEQHSGRFAEHPAAAKVHAVRVAVPDALKTLLIENLLHLAAKQHQHLGGLCVAVNRQHSPRQQRVQHPLGVVLREGLP